MIEKCKIRLDGFGLLGVKLTDVPASFLKETIVHTLDDIYLKEDDTKNVLGRH